MVQPPRFMTTLMRVGYDQPEVDVTVDRVMKALALDEPGIGAAEIEALRFRRVNYRQGYDMEQVDDWLDEVVEELRRREVEALPAGATPVATAPTTPAYEPTRSDAIVEIRGTSPRLLLALGALVVLAVLAYVALA